MPSQPLLVVDGDSLAHRAYHGLPKTVHDVEGRPANALVGTANMLLTLHDTYAPRTVLACWDTLTHPTYRHEQLPEYQAGREFAGDLLEQLERIPQFVTVAGFPFAKEAGYEADDFLAAAARYETERGGTTLIVTSDRDAFQLVSDAVTVLLPRRGVSELEPVRPADVLEKYGVRPDQVPGFIALRGDTSDRIPGATGIGPVKAAAALCEFGSLEGALDAGRFAAEADALRCYLEIATMRADAPLPPLPDAELDVDSVARWASERGLDAVTRRLAAGRSAAR